MQCAEYDKAVLMAQQEMYHISSSVYRDHEGYGFLAQNISSNH